MTESLLLDTHIALWLDSRDERLRQSTRDLIDACWHSGATVLVSTISAWEIAQLVSVGRIELDVPPEIWFQRFVDHPGIQAIPLSHHAASRAYQLSEFPHRDPADLLLIATAIENACPLVTYDSRIAGFVQAYGGQYGLAVAT